MHFCAKKFMMLHTSNRNFLQQKKWKIPSCICWNLAFFCNTNFFFFTNDQPGRVNTILPLSGHCVKSLWGWFFAKVYQSLRKPVCLFFFWFKNNVEKNTFHVWWLNCWVDGVVFVNHWFFAPDSALPTKILVLAPIFGQNLR